MMSAVGPSKRPLSAETAAWFRARTESLYLSTITAAEIEAGIAKLRRMGSAGRADNLREWFDRVVGNSGRRVLPFYLAAARIAGGFVDAGQAQGRYPGFADISIAAIAQSRQLTVLTVNLRHFRRLGVEALNPFAPS